METSQSEPAVSGIVVPASPTLRLAVAAYLARFKGTSREHTESALRCYLAWCAEQGLRLDMMDTSFFLGRETLVPTVGADMALWREKVFVAMYRNAGTVANYFNLPPNRVVELGSQVAL